MSKSSERSLPSSLARYIAASASRSISSAVSSPAAAQRDADARGHEALLALDHDRRVERGGDAVGDAGRDGLVVDARQEDRELVAAEAGDRVAGAQRVAQPLGDDDQQLVAGGVPERVVDDLELVEVDEEHGGGAGPSASASFSLKARGSGRPVSSS